MMKEMKGIHIETFRFYVYGQLTKFGDMQKLEPYQIWLMMGFVFGIFVYLCIYPCLQDRQRRRIIDQRIDQERFQFERWEMRTVWRIIIFEWDSITNKEIIKHGYLFEVRYCITFQTYFFMLIISLFVIELLFRLTFFMLKALIGRF